MFQLLLKLLYGSGLRLNGALRLRVKDVDFAHHHIVVQDVKGNESPLPMLPESLIEPLQQHLKKAKQLHQKDLDQEYGLVYLPFAPERKYPNADRAWI